jgi:hypothetical protein
MGRSTSGLGDHAPVQVENLGEREVAHLRQAPVEFAVLVEDSVCSAVEVVVRTRKEIPDGRGGELIGGDVEALRGLGELLLNGGGKSD